MAPLPSQEATDAIWGAPRPVTDEQPLTTNLLADICIVGGGIAGLSVAERLLHAGRSVVVLESSVVGGGQTSRSSAHLASAVDDRFTRLERLHGERGAAEVARTHAAAIDHIEALCATHDIDCEFRRVNGYLFGTGDRGDASTLERECAAACRAGLDAQLVERAPLRDFDTKVAVRFANQAQFDPLRYVQGLAGIVKRLGGRLYEGVHVTTVDEHADRVCEVYTRGDHSVRASNVVVATNAPITSRFMLPLEQAAYRTYCIAFSVPHGHVPTALYWDLDEPYHYVRVVEGTRTDIVIVGGEDHRTGQDHHPEARFVALEEWARPRFESAGPLVARWSGQILEPADGVGFVGRRARESNVFIVSGDSGDGLTLGVLSGDLITGEITGRRLVGSVYDPTRSLLRAAGSVVRENANTLAQYVDLVRAGDVTSSNAIAPGDGGVVREGATLLAIYRDPAGSLHTCHASCPHLGGVVHWNPIEKSWDCPCHGSRFDRFGRVLIGPANEDLEEWSVGPASLSRESREGEAGR